ncbi:flagellar hook-basal body complex protein FliE [Tindallia californiensis]|uniref:Flagellar hook-basal body complex protein FliE n=1 Tax=Tindallia californiensis TaxID=159292 RepID=A0A1H3NSG5_9FIRM|nr:flagellar hook-basal body complex protein FliE [Tindallia californiensis]SDY91774.1 flagellar hook-basal body complex protein FliE [Tindallia californiensis]
MQINNHYTSVSEGLGLFRSEKSEKNSFKDALSHAVSNVNQLQLDSNQYTEKLATGEIENVHEVMVASQKADIAMQMMTAVRGKMVDAYQEIMRMQI